MIKFATRKKASFDGKTILEVSGYLGNNWHEFQCEIGDGESVEECEAKMKSMITEKLSCAPTS